MTSVSIANLITVICLSFWLLPETLSADVPRGTVQPPAKKDGAKVSCYSMCDSRFSSSRSETWLACHHGCRFLTLLTQLASEKSRNNVKNSCLSACTEAYNETAQEKACHAGCGEQVRGKKKVVMERPVRVENKPITSTAAPKTAVPKVQIPANIRFFWSKSIVDEQDLDSSSEDSGKIPEASFLDSKTDPILILSSILPHSLLPQSVKITKSTVTYFGSKSLPAPQSTSNRIEMPAQPVIKLAERPQLGEALPTQPVATPVPSHSGEKVHVYASWIVPRLLEQLTPEQVEKLSNITHISFEDYGHIGFAEWTAIIVFSVILVSAVFIALFRSASTDDNYLPLSTSDTKKEEAAGGRCSSGDEDSSDLLLGIRPPSYEQAQQDEMLRPLLVSMGFAEPKHTDC